MSRARRSMRSRRENMTRRCRSPSRSPACSICRSRRFSMMESAVDKDEAGPGFAALAGRVVLLALAAIGAIGGAGMIAGFLAAYNQDPDGTLSVRDILILAGGA